MYTPIARVTLTRHEDTADSSGQPQRAWGERASFGETLAVGPFVDAFRAQVRRGCAGNGAGDGGGCGYSGLADRAPPSWPLV